MRKTGQVVDLDQKVNWLVIKQLLPYLKEFRWRILFALLCMVAAKLATIAMPFLLKGIVDGLSGESVTAVEPVVESSTVSPQAIPAWILTPIALVFAYGFFRFANVALGELRDTLFGRVTERAIRRISLTVFQHLHALDVDFHLNRRTGGLAREIERGTNGINFLMRFMVFNIIPTLLEISLVIGILLTQYGMAFGLVTLLSVVVYIIFSVLTTNWRHKYIRAANEADSKSNTLAIDSLLNYETVKYFTNEKYEANRYDEDLKVWEGAKQTNRLTLFALNGGQALIISSAITALMYLAVNQVNENQMTVGDFVLINAFMMQLFIPLNFLGFVYREIRTALVNIEKLFDLLTRQPKINDQEDAERLSLNHSLKHENESIVFEDVHFGYDTKREILKGISFTIEPRQTVAIVGASGSGKSTIAKLLFRFYDPNQGTIKIGEQSINQVTQNSLRKSIGIVPQDTVLFNNSILENIRYGNPSASNDEVMAVIKMAHLDQFISQLPEGVDTLVGERGLKLSGGEKQRVAIARALLKKPPIMIFDEATSSLDSHSEAAILQAIQEISGNYTSLVIAHRLSTVVNSDKIIVLEQGQIVESGSHT
ncbi:MAG: ABC transporter ATP-binding protein/permease, partial [Gammaproteobacteria bacterium]|nr:ABC transporter ATP-binding protein/permease [Gammaproteobacteria bacterium]